MQGYFTGLSALEHLERKKKSKTSILTHEKENNNVNFVLNIKKICRRGSHFIPREVGNLLNFKALPELT